MYPEQPDFETPYVYSIDGTAGDTPMTEIRGPTVEEQIAKIVAEIRVPPHNYRPLPTNKEYTDAILAILEIKEGQKLLEKAKSGKLVEKRCEVCDGEVQPHDDYCEPCRLLVNTEEDHQADELTRHQGV